MPWKYLLEYCLLLIKMGAKALNTTNLDNIRILQRQSWKDGLQTDKHRHKNLNSVTLSLGH